jgi:hypothetical protein
MASARLEKTFTASNRKTFTISTWIKRSAQTVNNTIYSAGTNDTTDREYLVFLADSGEEDKLYFNAKVSNSTVAQFYTNRRFRDTSAWYHIVLAFDTTQATDTNRMKLYVNGEQQTYQSVTYPSQNQDMNTNNTVHKIGSTVGNGQYFDGSMTHFNFIDGTAYDASTFGESDSVSSIWKPKTAPSVTYGTNGFFLKFENSGAMGTDSSGNSNTFTVNGTLTQNVDTPSNNFATWNPISTAVARSGGTFANGNTTITTVAAKYNGCPATLGMSSGKYYFEVKWSSGSDDESLIGIQSAERTSDIQELGHFATDYGYYSNNGNIRSNDAYQGSFGNTYSVNDIIGVAVDLDNNKLYFSKNGVWQNSGVPTSGSTGTGAFSITDPDSTPTGFYFPAISGWSNSHAHTFQANFGQGYFGTTAVASAGTAPSEGGIFEYDCPSGYQALCTKGINSF